MNQSHTNRKSISATVGGTVGKADMRNKVLMCMVGRFRSIPAIQCAILRI